MTRRLAELLVLVCFLIVAVALYKSTASFPEVTQSSTALYVRFLAAMLGIFSLLEMLLKLKKKNLAKDQEKMELTEAPLKFTALLVLMFVYAMLLEPLGFYLASALFLPLTMYILGSRRWLSIALTSGGVLLFVFLVFALLLGVPLPESTWFQF
ncbi:MAG: hypothetical protein CSB23_05035 [Deltaproteobacteria bacterium]|nr:MAG: hypothetical protein CSB23_05035 [Deltaproteobacteria bacterium]